jgi:hypothetical protein
MIDKDCVSSNFSMTVRKHNGNILTNDQHKNFVHNMDCKNKKLLLNLHFQDAFYIQANGSIFLPLFEKQKWRNPEDYCVEVFDNENMKKRLSAILCLSDEDEESHDSMNTVNVYGKFFIHIL